MSAVAEEAMSRPHVTVDVSAVPAQPAGAGVYVLRLVEAIAAAGAVDLELVAAVGDSRRWQVIAPQAPVHAVAPGRRPARLVWEQTQAPALAQRLGGSGTGPTTPSRCGRWGRWWSPSTTSRSSTIRSGTNEPRSSTSVG